LVSANFGVTSPRLAVFAASEGGQNSPKKHPVRKEFGVFGVLGG
jgi:hypothetical protein